MNPAASYQWLRTGDEAFAAMLAVINAARISVRLESYIFTASPLGEQFRNALVEAGRRGARVKVLIDAFGSLYLSDHYWQPLREAGGEFRWFNPLSLKRFGFRNHRKLLVVDDEIGILGGFNIAPEYQGDGVLRGWRDLGLRITGPMVGELAHSFDTLFALADVRHKRFSRLRRPWIERRVHRRDGILLQNGPGRGRSSLKRFLRKDLARAQTVRLMTAYFLPPWRIRRELIRLARRGGRVQLLLAGKSDVLLAQLACHRLYQSLLQAGIEIYEYQPQVLHAKLGILDQWVYVGSANLDVRSLRINYELMLRLRNAELAREAQDIFTDALNHSRRIDPVTWRSSRSFWHKLKERWAYFILVRVDPYLVRWWGR